MSKEVPLPFAGLRVLDLCSGIAGPYASKCFVDAGATVIKIESASGDPLRRWTASQQTLRADEAGPLFQYLNAGKKSLVLNPRDAQDRARFDDFAERVDIVLEDWGPQGLEDRGLDPNGWMQRNPRLSIVRISPWGQAGPWATRAASEFTLQAASGSLKADPGHGRTPFAIGGRLGDWTTGSYASVAALAAWRSACQTGVGQIADLSSFETMIQSFTAFADIERQFTKASSTREGEQDTHNTANALNASITRETPRPIDPTALIGNGKNLPRFEHMIEREIFKRTPGGFIQPRAPWHLESSEPAPIGPTSRLDQDREELLDGLKKPAPDVKAIRGGSDLPFAGLRVIDLTSGWAGPYTSSILSDFGAEVIKVESSASPDLARLAGVVRNQPHWEWSSLFHGANVGKRGIALQIIRPDGLELLKRLIADADLVLDNFPANVAPSIGLDASTLKSLNPRAIFVRMPAFGLDGPWGEQDGSAPTIAQISGQAWLTGYADRHPSLQQSFDPIESTHALFAIGLALEERERSGRGQVVEVPRIEAALAVSAEQVIEYSAFGVLLSRSGNNLPDAAPQGIFETRVDSERVAISVSNDREWHGLCRVLGSESWHLSEEFATHAGRLRAQKELLTQLSKWVGTRSQGEVIKAMLAESVPASACVGAEPRLPHPQLEARQFFQTIRHPVTGETRYPAFPASFSAFERDLHRAPPPTLGQHNREILLGELGISARELDRLDAEELIGSRPDHNDHNEDN